MYLKEKISIVCIYCFSKLFHISKFVEIENFSEVYDIKNAIFTEMFLLLRVN